MSRNPRPRSRGGRRRRVGVPAVALGIAAVSAVGFVVTPLAARQLDLRDVALRWEPGGAGHAHRLMPVTERIRLAAQRADARAAAARRAQPRELAAADAGAWSAPIGSPLRGIHAVMLPTGKVLFFGNIGDFTPTGHAAEAWTWEPPVPGSGDTVGTWNEVSPPKDPATGKPVNIFCSGHTFLPDGRLVVAGGNKRFEVGDGDAAKGNTYQGLEWILTFDPFTETWTRQPNMAHGRWYPSLTTLSDGRVVIMSGFTETGYGVMNEDVEVFTPSPDRNGVGTVEVKPSASRYMEFYPHVFTLPGDRVLLAGQNSGDSAILDTTTWTWRNLKPLPVERLWSTGVLEPYPGTGGPRYVTVAGGVDSGTEAAADGRVFRLDLADTAAGWTEMPPMNTGRAHHNTQLLPDGSELAVAGGVGLGPAPDRLYAGPVATSELRRPDGTWTEIPGGAERRTYHSTSVLLPDGRVVSAGDDRFAVERPVEIYSPPYLFRGARPVLAGAPSAVSYGEEFRVATPDAARVTRAVLMAPTSTTHSTDMGQREIVLPLRQDGPGALRVTAPVDVGAAPGGYYMLFLVDGEGRPSTAAWVRVTAQATPEPDPAPAPVPAPATAPPVAGAPAAPAPVPAAPPAGPAAPTGAPKVSTSVPRGALLAGTRIVRTPGGAAVVARFHARGAVRIEADAVPRPRLLLARRLARPATLRVAVPRSARAGDRITVSLRVPNGRLVAKVLTVPSARRAR